MKTFFNKKSDIFWLGVLGAITFVVYKDIFLGHEFLSYDDNWYIWGNKSVTNPSWESIVDMFTTPLMGQYSPLAELYHAILFYFFGKDAIAFKFFSLVVHFLNGILVFKISNKISENRLLAVFVTAVFLWHPMQVETVAWASAIYRIAAFFMLLGYWFYLKYLNEGFKRKYFALVILFFILGLFTKEQAVLFPLGLVLLNLQKGYLLFKKRIIIENVLFASLVLIFGFLTIQVTKNGGNGVTSNEATLAQNFLLFIDGFLGYLGNFLWPFNLSFSYPYPDNSGWSFGDKFFEIILFAMVLVLSVMACYKSRNLRFGILWGVGFLSLALSFSFLHMRDVFMADRYIYIAIIGFAFALFYAFQLLEGALIKNADTPVILSFSFLGVVAFSSYQRVPTFKNDLTLWTNAIEVNDRDYQAYNYLGIYYANAQNPEHDLDKALLYYLEAIKYKPNYTSAHINVGKAYFDQKKYKSALKHGDIALKLSPQYTKSYENRAAINLALDRQEDAIKDLNYLINRDATNVKFLMSRAIAYFKLMQFDKSIEDSKAILRIKADDYAFYVLGHSQFLLQQYKEAEENLTKAIAMEGEKGNYYFFRSHARLSLGKYDLALEDALNAKKYKHPVSESYLQQVVSLAKK